jgi:hypothetical protein
MLTGNTANTENPFRRPIAGIPGIYGSKTKGDWTGKRGWPGQVVTSISGHDFFWIAKTTELIMFKVMN